MVSPRPDQVPSGAVKYEPYFDSKASATLRSSASSPLGQELRGNGLKHLHDAMALLESKATAAELDGYRHFVLALAHQVAAAHRAVQATAIKA
jgi:hypothetical protein